MNRTNLQLIVCGLVAALVSGCGQLNDVNTSGGLTAPPERSYSEDYKIALLDQITITYDNPDSSPTIISVAAPGTIEYPPGSGDTIRVLDHTPEQVKQEIRARAGRAIKDISFNEYQGSRITVTGEVNIQTTFDIPDAPTHVLDAIAAAGGFTPLADQSAVRLTRHNAGKVEVFELDTRAIQMGHAENLNLLLRPGDRIYVPRSFL